MNSTSPCPLCNLASQFSPKRKGYFCTECEWTFQQPESEAVGQVFLSYGHDPECTELARLLRSRLEPEFKVWMDEIDLDRRGIRFGDDWRQRIVEGISTSDYMLALMSAHSTRKPGVCREEVALALGPLKGYVYSVLVQPIAEVMPPLILSQRQWLDMSEWRERRNKPGFDSWLDEHIEKIATALRAKSGFAGEMAELHRALRPLSQLSNHKEAEQGFMGRQWLLGRLGQGRLLSNQQAEKDEETLGEIERWAIEDLSNRVFWLSADPGWGKSAVIGRLAHAQRARVLAVHFCKHNEIDTQHAARVICSLAYQMASQLPDYRSRLLNVVRIRPDWESAKAGDIFRQLIQEPIAYTIEGGRDSIEELEGHQSGQRQRRLIVIDALDECVDGEGRSELLDILSERFRTLPQWLGLVVTSRREPAVVSRFRGYGMLEMRVFEEANRHDIKLYAQEWVKRLVDSGRLSVEHYFNAVNSVCKASSGNFLYLKQLEAAVMQDEVLQPSELLNPETLPADLPASYLRWFERKFKTVEIFEKTVLPLLELMLAAREPLPISLVDQVLGWNEREKAKAKGRLGSLIREEFGRLHFFHKSLADWLRDETATGTDWLVSESQGHQRLADTLGSGWDAVDTSHAEDKVMSINRYFADWDVMQRNYAMRHLPHHLIKSGDKKKYQKVLTDFAFAMQRCHRESIEWFLADYHEARVNSKQTELEAWTDVICHKAHLLRGGTDQWPSHRVLLQLALGHSDDSQLTSYAKKWMDQGNCNWTWMPKSTRPKQFRSTRQDWVKQIIHFGDQGRFTLASLDANWTNTPPIVACAMFTPRQGLGLVRVFDLSTGLLVWQADLPNGKIDKVTLIANTNEIQIQMNSGLLLEGNIGSHEALRDVSNTKLGSVMEDYEKTSPLPSLPRKITRLANSNDGNTHLAVCEDGSLWRWTKGGENLPKQLADSGSKIFDLAITRDGKTAASVSDDRSVSFWNMDGCFAKLPGHAYRATRICISDDGSNALSAGQDGMLILWDLQKAAMAPPQSFMAEVTALKIFNEDSDCQPMVFSGDLEGNLSKRIPPSMITDSNKWRGHTGRVWDVELTPCGSFLVTVGVETSAETRDTKGSIAIWELENYRCLARFASPSEVQASAVSGSGKYLVTATADRKISLWHLERVLKRYSFEQTCLSEFLTPSVIRSLQFLDENKIFSAGGDGVIRSWKISDDGVLAQDVSMNHGLISEAHVKEGPQQYGAYALALSPCNKYLACSGRGLHRAITIWSIEKPDLPMNVLVTQQLESTKGVHSIIFTNDGEHLLSANWEGSIQLWDWRESGGAIIFCQPEQHLSALVPAKSINRFVGATAMGEVYGMHLFTKFT